VNRQAKARVGVVAGDSLRSLGLITILEENVGVSAVALKLTEIFEAEAFSVLLLDMREPLEIIIQTITRLRRDRPAVKPIVMAEELSPEQIQAVVGAGAKGFLLETAGIREITMAIEIVLDGSIWAPRKVLASLVEAGTANTGVASPQAGGTQPIDEMLTDREREVMHLLMSGRSNREIAAAMGIEQATVKAHLGRMLRKTRASNRVELTLRAMEERSVET
jgi:DNA-binding NarL/FixJ family response regulator